VLVLIESVIVYHHTPPIPPPLEDNVHTIQVMTIGLHHGFDSYLFGLAAIITLVIGSTTTLLVCAQWIYRI